MVFPILLYLVTIAGPDTLSWVKRSNTTSSSSSFFCPYYSILYTRLLYHYKKPSQSHRRQMTNAIPCPSRDMPGAVQNGLSQAREIKMKCFGRAHQRAPLNPLHRLWPGPLIHRLGSPYYTASSQKPTPSPPAD